MPSMSSLISPKYFSKDATSGSDAKDWRRAMADKTASILKNDTWKLVKRPDDQKIIGSCMVLRNKYKPDGTLQKRKAKVVHKDSLNVLIFISIKRLPQSLA